MARTGEVDVDSHPYRLSSALTEKANRLPVSALVGPFGQSLGGPEVKAEFLDVCFERQVTPNPPADLALDDEVEDEVEKFLSLPIVDLPKPSPGKRSRVGSLSSDPERRLGWTVFPTPPSNAILSREFFPGRAVQHVRLSYFPQKWKKATVIVKPKLGKDATRVDSLGLISLLWATSKVLERLIQRRVRDYLRNFDGLIPEQFGFRTVHSTTLQLMRKVEGIAGAGCEVNRSMGVFLHVEKAFDNV